MLKGLKLYVISILWFLGIVEIKEDKARKGYR